MSDLFSAAKANLEAARQSDGTFGNQPHSNPGQLSGLTGEQMTVETAEVIEVRFPEGATATLHRSPDGQWTDDFGNPSTDTEVREQTAEIDMELEIYNINAFNRALAKLSQLNDVISAKRL